MILMTPATHEKSGFQAETQFSTKIPYSLLINDETIETKSGHLLQIIKIDGLFAETMDDVLIDHEMQIRNTLLMSLADSSTAIYFHTIRKKESCFLAGHYHETFAKGLQMKWNQVLSKKQFYKNEHYITIVKKPPVGKIRKLSDVVKSLSRKWNEQARERYRENMLLELNNTANHIMTSLAAYGAKKLSVVYHEESEQKSSQMLSFLSYLINLSDREFILPASDLAAYLPYKRIFFDDTSGTIAIRDIQNVATYAAILSIKEYCGKTRAGLLDHLLDIPAQMIITQSFSFLDKRYAREKIKEQERNVVQSDDGTTKVNQDIHDALEQLSSGESVTGEHHLSILCHAESIDQLEKNIGLIDTALNQVGMITIREDRGIKPAYCSQLPANHAYVVRRAPILSHHMAAFASLHNYSMGKSKGNHWGDAITVLETISGTPYYFNFHILDVGNTIMIGPQGSGKTLLEAFLLALSMKFGGRLLVFDKDKGLEIFVRAMRGSYATLSAGNPTGFAPFQMDDTEENRYFLMQLLRKIALVNGNPLSDQEEEKLREAVAGAYQLPKDKRILRNVVPYFGMRKAGSLRMRFENWVNDGMYAWIFDNELDNLSMDNSIGGFDLTALFDDAIARDTICYYLFHRIENLLDGTRTRIVGAEIWRALEDEGFRNKIKDWSSTPRKKNAFLVLDTQAPQDISQSDIGCKIIQESVTQIYFSNPKASYDDYVVRFGLSVKEWEIIKSLEKSSRFFLLKQGKNSVVVRADLREFVDEIAVLSGRSAYSKLLDQLRVTWGDEPQHWLPHYYQAVRGLSNENLTANH